MYWACTGGQPAAHTVKLKALAKLATSLLIHLQAHACLPATVGLPLHSGGVDVLLILWLSWRMPDGFTKKRRLQIYLKIYVGGTLQL